MKINFILPSIGISGGIKVVNKYADLLIKRGHDVVIYKSIMAFNMHRFNNNFKNIAHQLFCSIKAVIASFKPGKFDRYVLIINNHTVRDADYTIATSWPTSYLVAKLSETKGKKCYFIQGYEVWDNKKLGEESYKLPLNKFVIAKWIRERIGLLDVNTKNIPIIFNGVEFDFYNRNRSYHSKEKMRFLMLDHNLETKGVSYGIKSFNLIKEKYPDIKLSMFGLKRSNYVPDYAEYYENPTREELADLYNQSDVFLFPSLEEGWGLTVIEAMASGCAVVGTNVGCLLEIGIDKYNCMKSNPKDIEAMVSNIELIMSNETLYKSIVFHGKELAEGLSWERAASHFEEALRCVREEE